MYINSSVVKCQKMNNKYMYKKNLDLNNLYPDFPTAFSLQFPQLAASPRGFRICSQAVMP